MINQPTEPKKSDAADQAIKQRGRTFDPTGKIEQLLDDEVLVADIRRHPFALFVLYFQISIALTLSVGLILVFLPSVTDSLGLSQDIIAAFITILLLVVGVFAVFYIAVVTMIYKRSQLIVSDKNLTQVIQVGLFDRRVSELSLGNVEDVTARQTGIFPTLLNYGTLIIETAGEQNNFTFKYCPNPSAYAKAISDCRVAYNQKNGGE